MFLKMKEQEAIEELFGETGTTVVSSDSGFFSIATHLDTSWCVISRKSMALKYHFDHFPHAAENILPCWSWFRRKQATDNCGFALVNGLKLDRLVENTWQKQLVDIMGCKVIELAADRPLTLPWNSPKVHSPNLKLKLPRFGMRVYLERPEDAHVLRRRIISDRAIARKKGEGKSLQIGLIQRERTRVITNLKEIQIALQNEIPDAVISKTHLKGFSMKQQAEWFATKDVIIAAHGAALTNCLFITPGTIVMQLYPKNYFWQSLEPLIEQVGGIALDWYVGDDPHTDWVIAKQLGLQNQSRESDITAPVKEVVDPILFALGRKRATMEDLEEEETSSMLDAFFKENEFLKMQLQSINETLDELGKEMNHKIRQNEELEEKLSNATTVNEELEFKMTSLLTLISNSMTEDQKKTLGNDQH